MIITCIDKNCEWYLINDFLPSLFKYYSGTVAIIDYGLSDEALKEISKYNLHINKCDPVKQIVNIRMKHFSEFLESPLFKDETHVMMIDGGDVWFQDSFDEIFELCKDHVGFVKAKDRGTYIWMENYIRLINQHVEEDFYHKIMGKIKDRSIAGAGMVCGPKEKMIKLLKDIYKFVEDVGYDSFCLDMIGLNYLVRSSGEVFVSLPKTYDFNIIRFPQSVIYEEGIIYDSGKKRVKIVHNSGNKDNTIINRKAERDGA